MGNNGAKTNAAAFTIKEKELMSTKIRKHLKSLLEKRGTVSDPEMKIDYYNANPRNCTPTEEQENEFERILRSILPEFNLKVERTLERFPAIYVLADK
jgi:hypothetical protein